MNRVDTLLIYIYKKKSQSLFSKSTAHFLKPGGDGCELRVACCEVKNFRFIFLPRFFKVLPRLPATRNPQQILVLFSRWIYVISPLLPQPNVLTFRFQLPLVLFQPGPPGGEGKYSFHS
jgi:hypothetical protein